MYTLKISIVTLFFSLAYTLPAQRNPQPYFRNYGTEDGLPSPEVYCAFEDSQGYMWFGTDNGAARFDGYEFKTYGPKEGLMSNVVFDIYEDGKGRIWFGTMTGEVFILEGGTVSPYQHNHLVKKYEGKYTGARLINLEKDETAYIVLAQFGVLKIEKNGKVELTKGTLPKSILIMHLSGLRETIGELVYCYDFINFHEWILEQDGKMISTVEVIIDEKRFQKELPRQSLHDNGDEVQKLSTGELLIHASGNMHCLIDTQLVWSIPFNLRLAEIIPERDGSFWFCLLDGNGLRHYKNLTSFTNNEYDEFLFGLSVSKIFKDSKENYWIMTQEEGVFHLLNKNIVAYDSRIGLSGNSPMSVAFETKENLFIGMSNSDIYTIELKENLVSKIGEEDYPGYHNLSLLYISEKEELWGGGFYFKNGKKNYFPWFHPIWKRTVPYSRKNFDNLQLNSKGHLIGSVGHTGFHILDIETDTVVFSGGHLREMRRRVYGLHSDYADRLWLGLANGLFYFDFKDSTYNHPGITHPAFHHRVEDIDEMPDSTLVFGTKGFGVMFWKGDSILQVSDDDGLTSNMLEDVHVDENGICWAGTLNGLNKITFTENGEPYVRSFTMSNGLPSNEIYQIKSYEGQVWLCTAGGLVKFHERPENTESPIPIIQWVKVNNEKSDILNGQEYDYEKRNFQINFLSINYRMGGKIPYRYKINKDDEWQYTQNLSVNYPALTPSDYRFEVQAQNEDGYWSESANYTFSISPPWWQTWQFQVFAFFTITGAGVWFLQNKINQIKKENDMQRQMTELEKSALQAQMNPHFIFNCLNSIQHYILQNDRMKAVEFLARFAKLVRHNLEASRCGYVSLENEKAMLDNYLALEKERFNQRFDYEISIDENLQNDFIEFPCMLVQPFVENAVIHGMAEKKKGGKINIDFVRENGSLKVNIKDNGLGFRQSEKGGKTPRHNSAGMSITKKRLELLGADPESAIHIDEIKNEEGDIVGTEVNILIKIKEQ